MFLPLDVIKSGLIAARAIGLHSRVSPLDRAALEQFVHPSLLKLWGRPRAKRSFLMFSMIGRSLEFPSKLTLEQELEEFRYRRCYQDQPKIDINWITTFVDRYLGQLSEVPPLGFNVSRIVTNSATILTPQKDGGKLEEFRRRIKTEVDDRNSPRTSNLLMNTKKLLKPYSSPKTIATKAAEYVDILHLPKPVEIISEGKVAILAERGKSRPVTISGLDQGLYGDWIGSQLRDKMKKFVALKGSLMDDPSSIALTASPYKNVMKVPSDFKSKIFPDTRTKGRSRVYLFSGDLRAATDLLNKDLIDQFAHCLKVNPGAFYNATLLFPTPELVSRGTCLGLGGSWPALSLIHLFSCMRIGLPKLSYLIKGDDIIGAWTKAQILAYEYWLPRLTGMELQFRKCFVSPVKALFCEKAFRIKNIIKKVDFAEGTITEDFLLEQDQDIIPLAGLSKDLFFNPYSHQVEILAAIESIGKLKTSRIRIQKAQMSSPLVEKISKLYPQLNYLPSKYGGLGLRPPRRHQYTRQVAAYVRAVHNSKVEVPPLVVRSKHLQAQVERVVRTVLPTRLFLNSRPNQLVYDKLVSSALEAELTTLRTAVGLIIGDSGQRFAELRFRDIRRRLCLINKLTKTCSQEGIVALRDSELRNLQERVLLMKVPPPVQAATKRTITRRYS